MARQTIILRVELGEDGRVVSTMEAHMEECDVSNMGAMVGTLLHSASSCQDRIRSSLLGAGDPLAVEIFDANVKSVSCRSVDGRVELRNLRRVPEGGE